MLSREIDKKETDQKCNRFFWISTERVQKLRERSTVRDVISSWKGLLKQSLGSSFLIRVTLPLRRLPQLM